MPAASIGFRVSSVDAGLMANAIKASDDQLKEYGQGPLLRKSESEESLNTRSPSSMLVLCTQKTLAYQTPYRSIRDTGNIT
jgi:hypothetical protein